MSTATEGRFVWFDLQTTDTEGGKAFYAETIGLKVKDWEGKSEMPYQLFCVGDQPIGGVMNLPDEAKKMGAPPHWLSYVHVEDVDAATSKAEKLGGTVVAPAKDLGEVGRMAVIADPQGGVLAVFKGTGDGELYDGEPRPGDIGWCELNTTDWESAWGFYQALFGWESTEDMDMGPEFGTYHMFKWTGAPGSAGGMSNVAKVQNMPTHWLYYFTVDDIDAAVGRIKDRGGKIVNGPMEVPGGDMVAQCLDPQGVAFAIHKTNG